MNIYLIENNINHKKYIGITKFRLSQRFSEHISKSKNGSSCRLHKAFRKYGKENFSIQLIDNTEEYPEALFLEEHYISWYNTYKNGYNMNLGGGGEFEKFLTPESRSKQSITMKLKYRNGEIEPWNKNTIGIMKANVTSFKKGSTVTRKTKPSIEERQNSSQRIKQLKPNSQNWKIVLNNNIEVFVRNLKEYCKVHDLLKTKTSVKTKFNLTKNRKCFGSAYKLEN